MVKVSSKSNLRKVAEKLTDNSELFGDEIDSVVFHLNNLLKSAEEFGTPMIGEVNNMWGKTFKVIAYPTVRRHEWSF